MDHFKRDAPRPWVANAGDPGQVQAAHRRERSRSDRSISDLCQVLETEPGRRLLWEVLQHCRVFESIWHDGALIHYRAGAQDVGHYLLARIAEASPDALPQMMREAKADNT